WAAAIAAWATTIAMQRRKMRRSTVRARWRKPQLSQMRRHRRTPSTLDRSMPQALDTSRKSALASWLPWLSGYAGHAARDDVLAGSTLAAYAIPSAIAYAQLAGMPVQTGLYCYLFGGIAYALVGTSRQLAVGPTSSIALTLAVTLGTL